MSEYLKQLMQDFTFLEGCQALVNKDDYIDYCEHCKYQCRQFNVVKKFINYGMELERENKILKEQLQQKEDVINKVKEYMEKYFCKDDLRIKTILEILDSKGE